MAQDRIILEGMVFYGYHGATPEERTLGQRFLVDLELAADLSLAGKSDDLADTVDYGAVYKLVRELVEGPPRNLLEAVAQEIATRILARFPVEEVKVRVKKPGVPIKDSVLSAAAVEIVRKRPPR